MLCLKIAGWVANSVDPDETPRSAASHLGLYCLLRPDCPNTYGKLLLQDLYSVLEGSQDLGQPVKMHRQTQEKSIFPIYKSPHIVAAITHT